MTEAQAPADVQSNAPRRMPLALRALAVRLRFVLAVVAAGAVAAGWPALRNAWDRITATKPAGEPAVGVDSEFFCPMCPGVASDWPSKCPVCHMTLVRRPRGDAAVLPDGVIARMQLTPYRIRLAGIRTTVADWLPLEREIVAVGKLAKRTVEIRLEPADAAVVMPSSVVEVTADSLPARPTLAGKFAKFAPPSVVVALPADSDWPDGLFVSVKIKTLLAEVEPFFGRTQPPPLSSTAARTVFRCPNHPDRLHEHAGKCPTDGVELERRKLAAHERLDWWCPMHPKKTSTRSGDKCDACNGMVLLPRVTAYAPPGRVLAVPRSAVVQSGSQQIVFVETMAGMFDGRTVKLGAPAGEHFPVLDGVAAGEKVVASGAFLLDAESRLNPALAAAYFGATGAGRVPSIAAPPKPATPPVDSSKLSPADVKLAAAQKNCPVTDAALDSMGGPVKIVVEGQALFICCEGCEEAVRKDPKKYLAKLPAPKR